MNALILDGRHLTLEHVIQVAYDGRMVEIAPEAYERLRNGREIMEKLAQEGKPIYGFNRGVGWNKDRDVEEDAIGEYNKKLINSHALGVPPYNTDTEVRAMMVIRLNNALIGASCISDDLVNIYRDFLNHGIHPQIPRRGSVGEADITSLSHMGLAFIGEGQVSHRGEIVEAKTAIAREGISPYRLQLKDGHSIILSNAQGEGVTAVLVKEVEDLIHMSNLVYCLNYEGLNGNLESMREDVNALRGIPGQMECAAECRKFLEGSYLQQPHPERALQDSLTFRGGFSISGTVLDALSFLKRYLTIQINSPSDNPCIMLDSEQTYVTSNFETTTLAVGVEMLSIAMGHLSKAICYRMVKMTDPEFTHLTRFLAPWDNSSLGYATIQNTYTALDVENRSLVNPSSMDFYPLEGMIEDHGSNLPLAANKAMQIVDNLRYLVGMEAMYAAQAVDLRKDIHLGRYTRAAYDIIRQEIPFLAEDRNMHLEIKKAYGLISSKQLLKAVRQLD
ncbi:MAG: aromatic amino acid lyase [Bacillota bacterium]